MNEEIKFTYDEALGKLQHACAELKSNFDSIQIIATKQVGEKTKAWTYGVGNIFARIALSRMWSESQELSDEEEGNEND